MSGTTAGTVGRAGAVGEPEIRGAGGGIVPGQAHLEVSAELSALDVPLFAHYSRRNFLMTVRRSQESIYREILTAAMTGDEPTLEEIAGAIARLPKEDTGEIAELRQHLRQLCNLGAEVCDRLEESGLGGAAGSLDADPAFVLVNEVLHHHYGGPSLQELEEVDDILLESEATHSAVSHTGHEEAGDFEAPQERPGRAPRRPEKDQTQSPHMRVKSHERSPEWTEAMPDTGPSPWMGFDLGADLEDAPSEQAIAQHSAHRGLVRDPSAKGPTSTTQLESVPGGARYAAPVGPEASSPGDTESDDGEDLDLDPPSVLTEASVLANALQEARETAHPRRSSPDYGERPTEEFANPGILKGLRDQKSPATPVPQEIPPAQSQGEVRAGAPTPRSARSAPSSHAATWEHGAVPIPSSWRDDFESELSEEWEHAASSALDAAWPGDSPAHSVAPAPAHVQARERLETEETPMRPPGDTGQGAGSASASALAPPSPASASAAALIELVEEPDALAAAPLEELQVMEELDADPFLGALETAHIAAAAPPLRTAVLDPASRVPESAALTPAALEPDTAISFVESPPPSSFLLELLDQLGALDEPDMEAWMNFMQGPVFHPDHDTEAGVQGMRRLTSFLWEQVTESQKARERVATAESRMARVQRLENERQQNEAYLERVDTTLSQVERLVDQLFYAEPITWHTLTEDDFPVRPSLLSSLLRLGETVESWRQGSDDAHKHQEEQDLELEDLKELIEDKERFISVQDRQLLDREDRIVELQRGIERKNAELAKLKVLSLFNHLRFSVLDLRRRIDGALAPKGLLGRRKLPPPDQMKGLIADQQQIEKLLETLKDRVDAEELKPLEEDLSWLRRYTAAFRKVLGVGAEAVPAASHGKTSDGKSDGKKGAHGASLEKKEPPAQTDDTHTSGEGASAYSGSPSSTSTVPIDGTGASSSHPGGAEAHASATSDPAHDSAQNSASSPSDQPQTEQS